MSKHDSISQRIGQGVALLDANRTGWEKYLDLETLDLGDCTFCVLGQLYGSYDTGKEELGLNTGSEHGFDSHRGEFTSLTRAWRRIVAKRIFQTFKKYLPKAK